MSATSRNAIINKGIKDYKKAIFDEVQRNAEIFCDELCEQAILFRESAPNKHNFTGNFLNSIVVCLYKKKSPVYACYAAEKVATPLRVKMTAPKTYFFQRDYDGTQSVFPAEIVTNEGWGVDDARAFFRSYKPPGNNMFTIVVAYPVEYANWIEMLRSTTGILGTYDYAGTQFLLLRKAS